MPRNWDVAEIELLANEKEDIESIEIKTDPVTKNSRGFGFIRFKSVEKCSAFIEKNHNYEVDGKNITVELAKRLGPRKSTPGEFLGKKPRNNNRRDGRRHDN